MIKAYVDDTGGDDKPAVAMAGLIGVEADWTVLEQGWESILSEYGLPEYHGKKMISTKDGRFRGYCDGWEQAKINQMMSAFAEVIPDTLIMIGAGTFVGDYATAAREFPKIYENTSVFAFLMHHLLQTAALTAKEFFPSEPMALFLDRPKRRRGNMGAIADSYRDLWLEKGWSGTVTFAPESTPENPAKWLLLQPADFIAFELYKDLINQHEGSPRPIRKVLDRLLDRLHPRTFSFDLPALRHLADGIISGAAISK